MIQLNEFIMFGPDGDDEGMYSLFCLKAGYRLKSGLKSFRSISDVTEEDLAIEPIPEPTRSGRAFLGDDGFSEEFSLSGRKDND